MKVKKGNAIRGPGNNSMTLPNSLPNSIDITQLPFGGFLPPCVLAASEAFNPILRSKVFKDTADHIHADVRALVSKFGHAKRAESTVNSVKKESCFLSLGAPKPVQALLEFPIGHLDYGQKVIDVRPGVVLARMPALGTLLQGFVIPFFVLFDVRRSMLIYRPTSKPRW